MNILKADIFSNKMRKIEKKKIKVYRNKKKIIITQPNYVDDQIFFYCEWNCVIKR